MLPFEPETEEQISARFKDAVTPEYDVEYVFKHPDKTPTKLRKHVFDFQDGIRMGVSIDFYGGLRFMHFSFSVHPPRTQRNMDFALRILALVEKFDKPTRNSPAQHHVTPAGVEHFFFLLPPKT